MTNDALINMSHLLMIILIDQSFLAVGVEKVYALDCDSRRSPEIIAQKINCGITLFRLCE